MTLSDASISVSIFPHAFATTVAEAAALVAGERHATGRRGGDFGVPSPAQEDPAEAGPRPQGWGSVDEDGVASAREEALAVAELELLRAAVLSILHRKLPLEQALSVMRSRAGPLAAQVTHVAGLRVYGNMLTSITT